MYLGLGLFALLAVVLVYAFVRVKQRDRAYEEGEGFGEG